MGWLTRTLGIEKEAPKLRVDTRAEARIREQEGQLASALMRNDRAVRTAYDDLAKGVLAEVMRGKAGNDRR